MAHGHCCSNYSHQLRDLSSVGIITTISHVTERRRQSLSNSPKDIQLLNMMQTQFCLWSPVLILWSRRGARPKIRGINTHKHLSCRLARRRSFHTRVYESRKVRSNLKADPGGKLKEVSPVSGLQIRKAVWGQEVCRGKQSKNMQERVYGKQERSKKQGKRRGQNSDEAWSNRESDLPSRRDICKSCIRCLATCLGRHMPIVKGEYGPSEGISQEWRLKSANCGSLRSPTVETVPIWTGDLERGLHWTPAGARDWRMVL